MCAWYQTPVAPYDPINKEQEPNQAIRYLRDNFAQSGQDSNTLPPAQDPASWQQLTNVMPITQSSLLKRWGYSLFYEQNSTAPATRMYSFQNNITLARQIVYSALDNISASDETGVVTNASVFTPTFTQLFAPRMVDSRNYAYFLDGYAPDLLKWDGGTSVTNWGINVSSVTASAAGGGNVPTSVGPNAPATGTDLGGPNTWSGTGNIFAADGVVASNSWFGAASFTTNKLAASNFTFTVPATTILGIQVDVLCDATGGPPSSTIRLQLTKDGTSAYGATRAGTLTTGAGLTYVTFGGATDLWGGAWAAGDINAATFGALTSVTKPYFGSGVAGTFNIDFVRITVFYNAASSGTSSGSGVGIQTIAAGGVTLTVGRTYYMAFRNSTTGHYSDLTPPSTSTGPQTNGEFTLLLAVHTDPQVDYKAILATADGGDPSILYLVAEVPNATTTYVDNTVDTTLLLNQQYLYTDPFGNEFGVTFNDPPPSGTVAIKHKGRIWMAQQQNLFFSKAVAELTLPDGFIAGKYEESWPPQNYFDISGGAETISGLLSDGTVIYIGTQSHIRRIFGDSPDNFQQPEICHQDVGVLNQEVWETVFLQGTPTGFMWLSPDFKVMGSDGNTYMDLGHKIQDVLNSINPAAAQAAHAMFVQQGPFDLYILAIPTGANTLCDTHCVFNMRDQQWTIWKPSDPSAGMLFNLTAAGTPQWLFSAVYPGPGAFSSEAVYQYVPTATQDRVGSANPNALPANFTASATTPWLHLGSPTVRKVLDELEIVGSPTMLVTVNGSQTQANFASPVAIVSNAPLTVGPFSTYKVFLSAKTSKYKYYQLVFTTTDTTTDFVDSFCIRAIPWNTL